MVVQRFNSILLHDIFVQLVRIARNADPCNSYKLSVRPSVRLSVCLSITFWCFVQTNEDMIMESSVSGRTNLLDSGEVKFIPMYAGGYSQRER